MGTFGSPKFLCVSLDTCHALCGPRQTFGKLTFDAFSVLASGPLTPSPSAFGGFHHQRNLRGYVKSSGSAVFLVAYIVPCVRFNEVVQSLMSEICVWRLGATR
jgi:hypothetical protein